MNSKKVFYAMSGFVFLIGVGFIAVILLGNSILKSNSEELQSLKLEDRLLREQQTALIKAKQDIEKYQDFEQVAKAVVPQDKDQAKAVREIVSIASNNGITLEGISFPASDLGGGSTAPVSGQNQNPDAPSSSSSPSVKKSPVTQAKPVEGVEGVYSLEMVVLPDTQSSPVTFSQLINFLRDLENNRRTAQISQIRIDPVDTTNKSPYLDFSITLNIFVKP